MARKHMKAVFVPSVRVRLFLVKRVDITINKAVSNTKKVLTLLFVVVVVVVYSSLPGSLPCLISFDEYDAHFMLFTWTVKKVQLSPAQTEMQDEQ